ncbi:hypothetical protein MPTK1_3g19180 [Marchantia polymorpha subsp. ruderalis]
MCFGLTWTEGAAVHVSASAAPSEPTSPSLFVASTLWR